MDVIRVYSIFQDFSLLTSPTIYFGNLKKILCHVLLCILALFFFVKSKKKEINAEIIKKRNLVISEKKNIVLCANLATDLRKM